jgi:SNF2 family DNA or RNA helicase
VSISKRLTPQDMREYQNNSRDFALENPNAALFLDMGLGKTVSVLSVIKALLLDRERRMMCWLVVAPLRVAQGVWRQEAAKWTHTDDIQFSAIIGNEVKRRRALEQPAHVYLINVENLLWLLDYMQRLGLCEQDKWPFEGLIVDESSMFKNFKAKRFKELAKVLHFFRRRYILTGTPTPNSLLELWPQMYLLDMGERLGTNYFRYKERFFEIDPEVEIYSDEQKKYAKYVPRSGASRSITRLIGDIVLRLDAKDYLQLPPVIDNEITLHLPPEVQKMYNKFERDMFIEMQRADAEAISAAVLSMKCHQIANGALWGEERDTGKRVWEALHDVKIDAIREVVEGTGDNIIICYQFQHDLARLRDEFPRAAVMEDFKDIDAFQAQWNRGKFHEVLGHPKSFGHGLNMQDGGHTLAFFSLTWSREQIDQVSARIGATRQAQAGRTTKPITYHWLQMLGTVDEVIRASNHEKDQNQRAQLNALKAYRASKLGLPALTAQPSQQGRAPRPRRSAQDDFGALA